MRCYCNTLLSFNKVMIIFYTHRLHSNYPPNLHLLVVTQDALPFLLLHYRSHHKGSSCRFKYVLRASGVRIPKPHPKTNAQPNRSQKRSHPPVAAKCTVQLVLHCMLMGRTQLELHSPPL